MLKRKEPLEVFYTVQEVADALGRHPKTIRREMKAGRLKAHVSGRSIRVSASDYRVYVASQRR